ncbi:ferritin-like domain-containing protein [Mucilaginibacter ginkgonis]|uniref:Ferritin-like domain-containing protein n=1 Tax=Mucilaginibacter ginkgonis TaxID=2682091 RepID=A0A6I4I109_9SPHI|nr:ferritin-like domain-containing protein [Mucilaginibacter ginkgonis]QQL48378.1 ferritin-like domain-containing protein [Mucilaginibacter ginkgonis]
MNLFQILDDIQTADPEFKDRISPRRAAIKNITSFGSKVAAAAAPFAFTTLFKKAYGQTATRSVTDVLNFALTLEYLESYFYNQGLAQANLIPSADKTSYFNTIAAHENQHVAFLKGVLSSAAIPSPAFDLTAKGTFPDVLTNYNTFLNVSLAFEDTGVRAYKGQAGFLLGNQVALTAALQIHSVEGRHASAIRYLIKQKGINIKPWISGTAANGNDTGVAAANANYGPGSPAASFPSESNTVQAGVDLTTLPGYTNLTQTSTTKFSVAVEAYDEPLDTATVLAVVGPFIK